jgi:hypothetical protein
MKSAYQLLAGMVFILAACNSTTKPTNLANVPASLPASFNFDKMVLKVVASSISKKQNTMATLYGNEIALKSMGEAKNAPVANEVLTLITWQQKADDHWFGAKIPANLQSVEVIKVSADKVVSYRKYKGKDLVADADTTNNSQRIAFILHTQPSVMP